MSAVESGPETATDAEAATGVSWRSPTLLAVLLATLVTPMDVPLVSPALTQVTGAFGIAESRAGLLVTVYALPVLLAPVVYVALGARESPAGASEPAAADGDPTATDGGYVRGALRAVPLGRAAALYGAMFLTYVVLFGGLYTALPFHLDDAFGFGPPRTGLLTSAVLLVTAAVSLGSGRVLPHLRTTTVVGLGFACFTVGLLGSALAGSVAVLVGSLPVFGVGTGLVIPTLFGRLSALAPDRVRGGVMSLQTTTIGASQALGPLAFTLAGGAVGYQSLLLGASAATAFVAVSVPLTRTLPG